jgi:hypothetical protein
MNITEKKAGINDWIRDIADKYLIQISDKPKSESISEEEKTLVKILELSNNSKKITPHTSTTNLLRRK